MHSLGDIVHNEEEERRLVSIGLKVISSEEFINLKQNRVLFRAHGEPPGSYKIACRNATKVIDATCPVVKKLQARITKIAEEMKRKKGVVLIFGKKDHPEIIGLVGQAPQTIRVIENTEQVGSMNLPTVVRLFAQTTSGTDNFLLVQDAVRKRLNELYPLLEVDFKSYNSICKQVSGRERSIRDFANDHQMLLFVGGKESSNGKQLFKLASNVNQHSYYISGLEDVKKEWFDGITDVGITGATSTPDWLMEKVKDEIELY